MSSARLALFASLATIALFAVGQGLHLEGSYTTAVVGIGGIASFALLFFTSARVRTLLIAWNALLAAYLCSRTDAFWGVIGCGLLVLWCLIVLLPIMDVPWRVKVGFVLSAFVGALFVLWPTADGAAHGALHCPAYVKENIKFGIAPGLDLRGGMRLVYSVEVEEAIRDKRDNLANDMRQELATGFGFHSGDGRVTREELQKLETKVHVGIPESSLVRLKFTDQADKSKIDERFVKRFQNDLIEQMGPGPDEITWKMRPDIETVIREKAVGQAKDTVLRRVDELGLREASVTTRDEDIIVEVPGEEQRAFDDIKEIIRKTARLEFKMVDDDVDFFKGRENEVPEGQGITLDQETEPAGMKNGQKQSAPITVATIAKKENETQSQCLARLKAWVSTLQVPDDHQIGFIADTSYDSDSNVTTEHGWHTIYLFARAEITGDNITDATVGMEQQNGTNAAEVSLTFNPTGADRFEELTGANVNRRFAIILDDLVDSAPVILGKIGGGHARITMGAGDPQQQLVNARKLELVLRSGALPAPITPSNESRIGPSLGADAIDKGLKGALVGSSLVLAFMLLYYRKSGFVADVAVLFNLLLQLAILATFSATMTLPGLCGLALTIGMSVDANVLINERIREELRAGRTIRAAVEAGYDKAFSSIIDGHMTVLITVLILAQYGTGPVKGFAVALIVGIVCSLFTGVFCTRLVFDWWVKGAKVKRLSVGAEF